MSELIAYHLEDGIATLTLSNGKVNAISPAVVSAFNEALDQAEKDRADALQVKADRLKAHAVQRGAVVIKLRGHADGIGACASRSRQ